MRELFIDAALRCSRVHQSRYALNWWNRLKASGRWYRLTKHARIEADVDDYGGAILDERVRRRMTRRNM